MQEIFRQKNNLNIAEWMTDKELNATVSENELFYSKEQVSRAKAAHDFYSNAGTQC
jgi:hypothetical protein